MSNEVFNIASVKYSPQHCLVDSNKEIYHLMMY